MSQQGNEKILADRLKIYQTFQKGYDFTVWYLALQDIVDEIYGSASSDREMCRILLTKLPGDMAQEVRSNPRVNMHNLASIRDFINERYGMKVSHANEMQEMMHLSLKRGTFAESISEIEKVVGRTRVKGREANAWTAKIVLSALIHGEPQLYDQLVVTGQITPESPDINYDELRKLLLKLDRHAANQQSEINPIKFQAYQSSDIPRDTQHNPILTVHQQAVPDVQITNNPPQQHVQHDQNVQNPNQQPNQPQVANQQVQHQQNQPPVQQMHFQQTASPNNQSDLHTADLMKVIQIMTDNQAKSQNRPNPRNNRDNKSKPNNVQQRTSDQNSNQNQNMNLNHNQNVSPNSNNGNNNANHNSPQNANQNAASRAQWMQTQPIPQAPTQTQNWPQNNVQSFNGPSRPNSQNNPDQFRTRKNWCSFCRTDQHDIRQCENHIVIPRATPLNSGYFIPEKETNWCHHCRIRGKHISIRCPVWEMTPKVQNASMPSAPMREQ